MPTRKLTNAIERSGVNYVQSVIEATNCVFKEVHREHDYGHDAFVLLVDGEKVVPKEIALQIKAGQSYCAEQTCRIPATQEQLEFWRKHPLETLGVVFDPDEGCGYWVDLKAEAKARWQGRGASSSSVVFEKSELNRLDHSSFSTILLPLLLGQAPLLDLETARRWATSPDFDMHDLGVRTLHTRYRNCVETWDTLVELFTSSREVEATTDHLIWSLGHIPTHYDILSWFGSGVMSGEIRSQVRERLRKFRKPEMVKLLTFVDDYGFERSSIGQSVGAIISIIDGYGSILQEIIADSTISEEVKEAAEFLISEGIDYPMLPRD